MKISSYIKNSFIRHKTEDSQRRKYITEKNALPAELFEPKISLEFYETKNWFFEHFFLVKHHWFITSPKLGV